MRTTTLCGVCVAAAENINQLLISDTAYVTRIEYSYDASGGYL